MKHWMSLLCISLLSLSALSQSYTTAAGLRLGSEIGITLQQKIINNYTLEAMVQQGFFNRQTTITALVEQHHKLFDKGLNFYVGAGPHLGFYKTGNIFKSTSETNTAVGATIIVGIELKLSRVLLSFDYKPVINLAGGQRFFESQTGLSVRYVLIAEGKKKKRNKGKDQTKKAGWKNIFS
jgi:hypothetical protein